MIQSSRLRTLTSWLQHLLVELKGSRHASNEQARGYQYEPLPKTRSIHSSQTQSSSLGLENLDASIPVLDLDCSDGCLSYLISYHTIRICRDTSHASTGCNAFTRLARLKRRGGEPGKHRGFHQESSCVEGTLRCFLAPRNAMHDRGAVDR